MPIQKQYYELILLYGYRKYQAGNTTMCFILDEVKETILDFLQETVKVLYISSYSLATAFFINLFRFIKKTISKSSKYIYL